MEIKIIIVDDHELVRDGLELNLSANKGIDVIGTAGDYSQLKKLLSEQQCDLILLDISLPQKSGIEITQELKKKDKAPKIIILTSNDSINYLEKAIRAGADGFLSKSSSKAIIIQAIESVFFGNIFIDQNLSQDVYQSLKDKLSIMPDEDLSEREIEIVKGFADGLTYKDLADRLNVSKKTIETHKTNIFKKLNLSNQSDLIKYAIKKGYTQLD